MHQKILKTRCGESPDLLVLSPGPFYQQGNIVNPPLTEASTDISSVSDCSLDHSS
jgi:hypothetical protein